MTGNVGIYRVQKSLEHRLRKSLVKLDTESTTSTDWYVIHFSVVSFRLI